jgi:hypothetical protein
MTKISRIILNLLTYSFVISVVCLLISYLSREGSLSQHVTGFIGIGGLIVYYWVFVIHVISVLIGLINNRKP